MEIPTGLVLKQLRDDLIGKDSHRGVTLTYSWLANQFGHFSLGFIPTFLLYLLLNRSLTTEVAIMYATIAVAAAWTLFEAYNFLGPLNKLRKTHVFKPAYRNIAFDTFTDLCFFYFGGLIAHLVIHYTIPALIILLVLIILLGFLSRYWYVNKIYLQIPEFPYQLRLSQWKFSLAAADKEKILRFIADDDPMHILLFGGTGTGKTSLAVATLTELAIRRKACLYTTTTKILGMFFKSDEALSSDSGKPWFWRSAACLVIDDLNPGNPISEILTPNHFLALLKNEEFATQNLDAMKNKKLLWVIGDKDNQQEWIDMVKEIGVPESMISAVEL